MLKVMKNIMSCLGIIFTLLLMMYTIMMTIAVDDIRNFQQELLQQQQIETEQFHQEMNQMRKEVKELQYEYYLINHE